MAGSIPAAPLTFQLPACGPGKQSRTAQSFGTLHPRGRPGRGSWLQIGLVSARCAHLGSESSDGRSSFLSLLSVYPPFQWKNNKNKSLKKKKECCLLIWMLYLCSLAQSPSLFSGLRKNRKFIFWRYLFLLQSQMYREEESQGNIFIRWFTAQVTSVAAAEPSKTSRQKPLLGPPHRCRVPKIWALLHWFPRPQQLSGLEARLPRLEPAPIWDTNTFKARTLDTRPQCWAQNRKLLTSWFSAKIE